MVLVLGAKVVQVEHNGKKNYIFLALSRRSLPSPQATVVQVERSAKQKTIFFVLNPETQPTFAADNSRNFFTSKQPSLEVLFLTRLFLCNLG